MAIAAMIFVVVTAAVHFYIAYLEMFRWPKVTKGLGLFADPVYDGRTEKGTFRDVVLAETRPMGLNQGLYNGFLAAGLLLTIFVDGQEFMRGFLLICVVIAGVIGAWSLGQRLLLVAQSLPAAAALIAIMLG